MVDSSKDVLFLTLSAAIVVLTFFVSWALYLMIQMLRDISWTTKSVRAQVEKLGSMLDLLKEKIATSTSYLGIIAEGARQLLKFWRDRQTRKPKKGRAAEEEL